MAKHLARIHGTEEDKVNCPFYFKIGACRHLDRCSRLHHKPAFSPTILIKHLYRHPVRQAEILQAAAAAGNNTNNNSNSLSSSVATATAAAAMVDKDKAMEDFLCFFEDLYMELSKFGRIEALHIVDNLGDHMIGHVYCKFRDEEEASDALQVLHGRYYDGRRMQVEFSPVTDFREARCRDYDEESCSRGGFCNFLHVKPVPLCLIRSLEEDCCNSSKNNAHRRRKQQQEQQQQRKKRDNHENNDNDDNEDDDDDHAPGSEEQDDDDDDRRRRKKKRSSSERHHHRRHHRSHHKTKRSSSRKHPTTSRRSRSNSYSSSSSSASSSSSPSPSSNKDRPDGGSRRGSSRSYTPPPLPPNDPTDAP